MASTPLNNNPTPNGASNQDGTAKTALQKNLLELLELTKAIRKTPQSEITKNTLGRITKRFLDQESDGPLFDEATETTVRETGAIPPINHAIWTCLVDITWAAQRELNRGSVKRLDEIDNQLETIGTLLGEMENRVDGSGKRLTKLSKRLCDIEDMFVKMEASLSKK